MAGPGTVVPALSCTAFAITGAYLAFFHSVKLMTANVVLAVATGAALTVRIADDVGWPVAQVCGAAQHDAPALGDIVIVGFEHHVLVEHRRQQLGAFGGAEQQRPVLDDEVDREDLGPPGHRGDEAAQRDAGEQIPAVLLGELGDRRLGRVGGVHDPIVGARPAHP